MYTLYRFVYTLEVIDLVKKGSSWVLYTVLYTLYTFYKKSVYNANPYGAWATGFVYTLLPFYYYTFIYKENIVYTEV